MPWSSFFECWVLGQLFSLPSFTFIKRLFSSSLLSAIKGSVICISEVTGISPGNLDSRLCFIQPSIFMMHSAYKLNKQGDHIQPWRIHFPILNESVVPFPVLTVASWTAYKKGKVAWYSHLFKNFPCGKLYVEPPSKNDTNELKNKTEASTQT